MFWWAYLSIRQGGQAALDAGRQRRRVGRQPFVDAGTQLKKLIDLEAVPEGLPRGHLSERVGGTMGNGKAAMELMGQWAPGAQAGESASKKGIGEDLAWFPFPAVAGGAGAPDRCVRRRPTVGRSARTPRPRPSTS